MRTLIFRAMALVLGLFTMTAVFAVTFSDASVFPPEESFFFDQSITSPADNWDEAESWLESQQPGDTSCGLGTIACKITVPSSFTLQAYLIHLRDNEGVTWSTLASHPSVQPRS